MPYVLLIDELEARKNGELLRPFFRRFAEEGMRSGQNGRAAGSPGMDSHQLGKAVKRCVESETKIHASEFFDEKNGYFTKIVSVENVTGTQSNVPGKKKTKKVNRMRGHAISEANIARGEGFEPSLSNEK